MTINKKITLIMLIMCLPGMIVPNPYENVTTGLPLGLIVGFYAIVLPIGFIPSFVGWNACAKRQKLQDKVRAFKITLNKEQLVKFNQNFQPYDTWAVTKAPFCTQLVALAPMMPKELKSAMWLAAVGLAGGAQYLEHYNEEQFNQAVEAVEVMDATSSLNDKY
jgi:hypothetical protein